MFFTKILKIIFIFLILGTTLESRATQGNLDNAIYTDKNKTISVSGWVTSGKQNVFATNIIVNIDDFEAYRGRMLGSERPDVVEATGHQDWLSSGFSVTFKIPDAIPSGKHNITVKARLSDGTESTLSAAPDATTITLPEHRGPTRLAEFTVAVALLLPIAVVLSAPHIRSTIEKRTTIRREFQGETLFIVSLAILFLTLVLVGLTGSSITLLLNNGEMVSHDAQLWAGENRAIRSDEWEVITPMAISQKNHIPAFPVVNTNWGNDGHNMLVVGMTGVPVKHVSTIAKPATWGFFLFDLKRALAWYWWFPFFSCLFALWQVFLRFFNLEWRIAAGLATAFTFSPYAAGFSGWPAYAAFFPLVSLLFAKKIIENPTPVASIAHGLLLGVSMSGFALLLYPAWQISLGYGILMFGLAWLWSQRTRLKISISQFYGAMVAIIIFSGIMTLWWDSSKDAVHAIRNTVYPGSRVFEVGGDIDPWFFIKGLLSLQTMYRPTSLMDQSDASSFIFVPLALIVAGGITLKNLRTDRSIGIALATYMLAVAAYMFLGSNSMVARWSLWGAVTSYRLDLSLGLIQTLFMGWLFSKNQDTNNQKNRLIATITAGITIIWGSYLFRLLPQTIYTDLLQPVFIICLVAWGYLTYLIIGKNNTQATAILCAWTLSTSIPFNPIGEAPNKIELNPLLLNDIDITVSKNEKKSIAIIDERTWPLFLSMDGKKVTNSVFYYPPSRFWKDIDPTGEYRSIYNRYQRLFLKLQTINEAPYRMISSPRLDEVVLTMDPENFDFHQLGAGALLTPKKYNESLSKNISIEYIKETDQWAIYRIKNPHPYP